MDPQRDNYPTKETPVVGYGPSSGYDNTNFQYPHGQAPPPSYNQSFGTQPAVVKQPVPGSSIVYGIPEEPPTRCYFYMAVFACACFCWPLGLVAVCQAQGIRDAWESGDVELANRRKKYTLFWILLTILIGTGITVAVSIYYYNYLHDRNNYYN